MNEQSEAFGPSAEASGSCAGRLFAQAAAGVVATGLLPPALLKACVNPEWRASLPERFGGGDWKAVWQSVQDGAWFHAASVGEVGGIVPVLKAVRAEFPSRRILVSTTSVTGKREASQRKLADSVCLLPFDHPSVVRRVLNGGKPRLVIISETELWPNLLFALDKLKIPVVLINGRISDYSFPRYRRIRRAILPALSVFQQVLVQTELDAERFLALGVEASRVAVVGSTKYDQKIENFSDREREEYAGVLGLSADAPCFVAGSVRAEEDEEVIRAYGSVVKEFPELQMIIAPRHPERFEEVAKLLSDSGIAFHRRSAGDRQAGTKVLLLDTMGELRKAYGLATIAFVGGSLVDIGGHNPLEPAAYKAPVLVGPYTSTVRDAVKSLKEERGLYEVSGSEDLKQRLLELLGDSTECSRSGEAAYQVWQKNVGATERVMGCLRLYLK